MRFRTIAFVIALPLASIGCAEFLAAMTAAEPLAKTVLQDVAQARAGKALPPLSDAKVKSLEARIRHLEAAEKRRAAQAEKDQAKRLEDALEAQAKAEAESSRLRAELSKEIREAKGEVPPKPIQDAGPSDGAP